MRKSFLLLLCLSLSCNHVLSKKPKSQEPLLRFHLSSPKPKKKIKQQATTSTTTMCRAHSHNDYHQDNPLSSALKHGLKSVEVDVFPRKNGLWVGHTVFELDPKRTIESLYIEPLLRIFKSDKDDDRKKERQHGLSHSQLFPKTQLSVNEYPRGGGGGGGFGRRRELRVRQRLPPVNDLNLLVDFKGSPDESARLLQAALRPIRPFLSKIDRKGVFRHGRLTVIVSGCRPSPASLQCSNGERFLFLDGRVKDIHANADTHLVPLVSLPWRHVRLARAVGRGESYMRRLSDKAHAQGKLVRIWGAPNHEKSWHKMVKGNIDLLSIDDHAKFARFVAGKQPNEQQR